MGRRRISRDNGGPEGSRSTGHRPAASIVVAGAGCRRHNGRVVGTRVVGRVAGVDGKGAQDQRWRAVHPCPAVRVDSTVCGLAEELRLQEEPPPPQVQMLSPGAVRIRSALVVGAIRHREISRLRRWQTTSGVQPRTKLPGASACSAVHGVRRTAGAAIDAANIGCDAVLRRSSKMIRAGAAADVPTVSAASASSPGARSPRSPRTRIGQITTATVGDEPRDHRQRRTFVSGSATCGRRSSSISPAAMVSCFGVGAIAGPHRVSSRRGRSFRRFR